MDAEEEKKCFNDITENQAAVRKMFLSALFGWLNQLNDD
jgi:hypothetical protein